jgi:hypothetical protein
MALKYVPEKGTYASGSKNTPEVPNPGDLQPGLVDGVNVTPGESNAYNPPQPVTSPVIEKIPMPPPGPQPVRE